MTGDRPDFARVYEENVWRVYGFFAYRVRDRPTAEDLTQGTFERALRAWARFDPRRGSERTWLMAIAANLLIDHQRRRRAEPVESFDERAFGADAGPEARSQAAPELLAALGKLSGREREIVALRFGGDLSPSEIAAVMRLSVANVHQILSRTLRKLRADLDGTSDARVAPGADGPEAPPGPR